MNKKMVKQKNKLVSAGFGMKETWILQFKSLPDKLTNWPINQQTNIVTDQPTHQPTDQSTNQPILQA